jgi:hypothetical protein
MAPAKSIAVAMGLSVIVSTTPVLAGQQVYIYSVVHPFYGEIGTLTDTVERSSDVLRIDSRMRIAVDLLGVVVYRHESDTTEIMRNGRLISLQSVIEKDGQHLEVHGEAQGDQFVVNATAGSFTGPAATAPCDPWVLKHTGEGAVVYPVHGQDHQCARFRRRLPDDFRERRLGPHPTFRRDGRQSGGCLARQAGNPDHVPHRRGRYAHRLRAAGSGSGRRPCLGRRLGAFRPSSVR